MMAYLLLVCVIMSYKDLKSLVWDKLLQWQHFFLPVHYDSVSLLEINIPVWNVIRCSVFNEEGGFSLVCY